MINLTPSMSPAVIITLASYTGKHALHGDTDEPQVVFCVGEFGPLNLQRPGRQWAAVGGKSAEPARGAAAADARGLFPNRRVLAQKYVPAPSAGTRIRRCDTSARMAQ